MTAHEIASMVLLAAGGFFFVAGTMGMLRLPDVRSRLHALTKADNVGLGLVAAGLALIAGSAVLAAKVVLIWLLAMLASSTSAQLIARRAGEHEEEQGREPESARR